MKPDKLISLGKLVASAIIILGIIHVSATFTPLIKGGLACLSPGTLKAMIYMSLICGSSFILSGMILILLLKRISQFEFLSSSILLIGIFLAISGILSIIFMVNNPFAWIALLLNLLMFIIAMVLKIKF